MRYEHSPRLVEIEQRRAHAVDEAVAGIHHAVIDHQPAVVGFDGDRAGADLGALPPLADFVAAAAHHEAVHAPVAHVGALADVDVAERRVAVVAGAAEHEVLAVDLSRKQHAVAIERQERVFQPLERSGSRAWRRR